jgi:hypothetical protein
MKVLNIICLFLTIYLSSCKFSKSSKALDEQYLIKTKSMHLPLDEKSTYEFFVYQVVADSFLVLNQVNYSLDIYSLSEEKLIGRINVEREGLNGLERLNTFHYHNKDSIFLFPQFQLKNSLITDIYGNVIDRIQHNEFKSDIDGLINHVGTPPMPTILFDDELHFSVFQLKDESIEDADFIHEHSLNLKTGNFTSYPYIKKPKFFHNNRWVEETFSRIKLDKEEWYFSWNLSDTVYHIVGSEGKLKESIPIGVNGGIITVPKAVPRNSYKEKWPEIISESFVYGKILYDNERKIIHRVRYFPMIFTSQSSKGTNNPYLQKNFEILTHNLDGEFLGSTKFKSGIYDPRVLFLGPGGIYLPKIHPSYEGLNEDEIVYDVFNIQ